MGGCLLGCDSVNRAMSDIKNQSANRKLFEKPPYNGVVFSSSHSIAIFVCTRMTIKVARPEDLRNTRVRTPPKKTKTGRRDNDNARSHRVR